jgi:hypothetical protein
MELSLSKKVVKERPERLSELLRHVSQQAGDKISLGVIAEAMADRSFGAFLVVFCLPNLIPLPPGATFILGLPLVFIAFQMAFSRLDTIWLPKRLHDYSFDNKAFLLCPRQVRPVDGKSREADQTAFLERQHPPL